MGVVVNGPWPMSQPLPLQNEFCSNGSPEKNAPSPWLKRIRILKSLKKKIGIGSRGGDNAPNNLPPLHFHSVHGENIEIRHGGTVARRVTSFCNAVTFSDRPIKLNEKICLKFIEICHEWSGVVRFGFTNKDPKTLSSLPPYSIPNLTSQPGFWAGTFKDNSKDLIFNEVKRDVTLYYYLNPAGNIQYGVNGEEKGLFLTGVDTRKPLWALIDVYGKTTAIELMDPRGHLNNSQSLKSLSNDSPRIREEIEMTVVPSMSSLTLRSSDNDSQSECQPIVQRFRHKTQPLSQSHRNLPNSVYYSVRPRLPLPTSLITASTPSPKATCSFNSSSRLNIPNDHQPTYQSTCSTSSIYNHNQHHQQQNKPQPQQHCPPTARIRPVSCSSSALQVQQQQSPTSSRSKCEDSLDKPFFSTSDNSPKMSSQCRPESQPQTQRASSPIYSSTYPDSKNWSVECGSCGTRPVDTVFYPCGHMCLCYECAFECWTSKDKGRCPICQTPISEVILRTGRP